MMRATLLGTVVVLLCVGGVQSRDAKEDLKMLDGTWLPVSGELAGEKYPEATLKMTKLVIKDGKWTVTIGDINDAGTFTLDTAKKPNTMDIVGTDGPNKGKTIPAVYELKDDTLKICYGLDGKERPKEFKTKEGTKEFLLVYKRQKP
jgi:uncharacterized protein (TIGR03067 family)